MSGLYDKMERYVVRATPNAIVDVLGEYVDAGCDHLILVPYVEGVWSREELEVLRTEVMPHIRR
jgi:hypothetical protein